jgi:hypothetical protein
MLLFFTAGNCKGHCGVEDVLYWHNWHTRLHGKHATGLNLKNTYKGTLTCKKHGDSFFLKKDKQARNQWGQYFHFILSKGYLYTSILTSITCQI